MIEMKSKWCYRLCVILIGCLPLSLWGQTDGLTFEKENYSITYPKNWDLDDSNRMGAEFLIFSRLENEKDQFKENINLLIQDLSAYNMSLDQYVELSIGQVKSMIKDGKVISSKRISEGDREYHSLIYGGRQAANMLRFEQRFWIINKTAYILTFTAQLDNYDLYRELGNQMIDSFKIN